MSYRPGKRGNKSYCHVAAIHVFSAERVPNGAGEAAEIVSDYFPVFHARPLFTLAESTGIRLAAVCE